MILVDTSGAYALVDRSDPNHERAAAFLRAEIHREDFATCLPVLTEAWYLLSVRISAEAADQVLAAVIGGAFHLLEMDRSDLETALEIDRRYREADFGFVDSSCFALCERHRIGRVMTFDRRDFRIYRPTFCDFLELVP